MDALPFWRIDAFVGPGLLGNPAAILECRRWPDDLLMQTIAQETGGTATAFLLPDTQGAGDWQIRWFSPRSEIRLCGHASLACADMLLSRDGRASLTFRTRSGAMITAGRAEGGAEITLPAIDTAPGNWPEAVAALGQPPVELFRSERGYAVFFYRTEDDIRALEPDFDRMARLGNHQLICTAPGWKSDIVSRVFTPGAGACEDIATGSAHAVLAPLWVQRLGRAGFSAIQASTRGGWIHCRLDGGTVALGGECSRRIEGRYYLSG